MERGVVATPGIIHVRGSGFTLERSLSPQELRYYALYWDKVVIPASNLVYIGIPEENTLIETGVVSRPRVQFRGSFSGAEVGNSFAIAQAEVGKKLIAEEPSVDWVLHQFGSSLAIPNQFSCELRTVRFELVNLLPVPSGDVPMPDVLEFKERRRDEFANLHKCLDEAYLEALRSPDPRLGSRIAVGNLREAIASLDAVSTESWKRTTKYDFSAELNIELARIAQGAAAGAAFDFFLIAMTIPVGTIAGAIVSAFKLSAKASSTFEPAQGRLKLSYLSHARNEHILK